MVHPAVILYLAPEPRQERLVNFWTVDGIKVWTYKCVMPFSFNKENHKIQQLGGKEKLSKALMIQNLIQGNSHCTGSV